MIFGESDLADLIMQGQAVAELERVIVDDTVDLSALLDTIEDSGAIATWARAQECTQSVAEFDAACQSRWYMPAEYRELDIAAHVLSLCRTPEQLQRVGHELLLFQEKNLFDLLRYLKYLVDVMTENRVIWGVGRGSSVASYVLYLLGVHRIDSLYYDLDPEEFLR